MYNILSQMTLIKRNTIELYNVKIFPRLNPVKFQMVKAVTNCDIFF